MSQGVENIRKAFFTVKFPVKNAEKLVRVFFVPRDVSNKTNELESFIHARMSKKLDPLFSWPRLCRKIRERSLVFFRIFMARESSKKLKRLLSFSSWLVSGFCTSIFLHVKDSIETLKNGCLGF